MRKVLNTVSILTVLVGAVLLAGDTATTVHAAEPVQKNCWEGTNSGGSIVHSFDEEAHTPNRTCDADGEHDQDKPDMCSQHHFHCS